MVRLNEHIPSPPFRVGEPVPESGVYRVFHSEHRASHEVTLVRDQAFPHCSACGNNVRFELLDPAPAIDRDPNFSSRRLYEIPHPEENGKGKERRSA